MNQPIPLLLFAALVLVGAVVAYAVKRHRRRTEEQQSACKTAEKLRDRTDGLCGGMTLSEYDKALHYVINKYKLCDRYGGLDLEHYTVECIAQLAALEIKRWRGWNEAYKSVKAEDKPCAE